MTTQSQRSKRSLTSVELIDNVLDSDERTSRAKSLLFTVSACIAAPLLVASILLAVVLGSLSPSLAGGVGGVGTLVTLAAAITRRVVRKRQLRRRTPPATDNA
jgi:hypothetical protein